MTKYQDINFPLQKLPPMPAIAAEVIELINAPSSSAGQLATVVSRDASMSAKVLQIANSSFYGLSRQITTLSSAIVLIGERTLTNLVLAVSLQGMNRSFGATEKMLWEDSIICALGSRFFAQRLELGDPEEVFMAGLFRHIGKIAINNQDDLSHEQRMLLNESVITETTAMSVRELQQWGASHDQIGAAVIEQWQLSEVLSLAALHHFDLNFERNCPKRIVDLICMVNIANSLPTTLGALKSNGRNTQENPHGAQILGLTNDMTETLTSEFCSLFRANENPF